MSDDTNIYRPWRTDDHPILPPELKFFEARLDALERRIVELEAQRQSHSDDTLKHPAAHHRNHAA